MDTGPYLLPVWCGIRTLQMTNRNSHLRNVNKCSVLGAQAYPVLTSVCLKGAAFPLQTVSPGETFTTSIDKSQSTDRDSQPFPFTLLLSEGLSHYIISDT